MSVFKPDAFLCICSYEQHVKLSPWRCGTVGWSIAPTLEGFRLGPCSGHMPCFAVYNVHPFFDPNIQGEKISHFNFLIQFFVYSYLDTCFLYYKGILAFIFKHIMVQEILCNK